MGAIDLSKLVTAEMKAEQARAAKNAAIEAERARRLAGGFAYDFADARGTHRIGTSASDMAGWDEVTKLAQAMIATGDTVSTIMISTETGAAAVTALEWQAVLVAAGAFRQPIWQASFMMQAMDPMPEDVTDDALWPASETEGE